MSAPGGSVSTRPIMRPEPREVTDEDEITLSRDVVRRLRMIENVTAKWDDLRESDYLPHSQLAQDDRATAWLHVSHQVRAYINLAADVARSLCDLVLRDGALQLPMHAHYPLLRSIIEASAEVTWILEPEEHSERVQRGLQARITELKWDQDLHQATIGSARLFGQHDADFIAQGVHQIEERRTAMKAKIRELNDAAGLDWSVTARGLPFTAPMLREVGKLGEVPGEFAESVWRLISGLTHPSASRSTQFSSIEVIREASDGVISARVSASMQWTHSALLVALYLYDRSVSLYRVRRTKPATPTRRSETRS